VPQNEQSGANQAIRVVSWVVYYTNSTSNISAQFDDSSEPPPPSEDIFIVEIVREEECATED
jgi:hypothetical protein